jgi:uncharacterized repeat protein (TIGR01451 family)
MARMRRGYLLCVPRAAGHRRRMLRSLALGVSNFRRRAATMVAQAAVAAGTLFLTVLAGHAATLPPSLSASFIPGSISVFGNATLEFTISNPNATALTGVSFTDVLPRGLTVQLLNVSQCSFTVTTAGAGDQRYRGQLRRRRHARRRRRIRRHRQRYPHLDLDRARPHSVLTLVIARSESDEAIQRTQRKQKSGLLRSTSFRSQ